METVMKVSRLPIPLSYLIAALFCAAYSIPGKTEEKSAREDKPPVEQTAPTTCDSPVPKVTPTENLKYVVSVDPHTVWRPVGGEVSVTLTGQNNQSLSGLVLQTCFARRAWGDNRKFIASGPITIVKSSTQEVTFRTTVPDLTKEDENYYEKKKAPNWLQRKAVDRWRSLVNDSSLVPIADLRVIGSGAPPSTFIDVLLPVGVTSVSAALMTTFVVVALAFLVLWRFVTGGQHKKPNFLLAVISTDRGTASLSQFQVVMWTFVVGASAVYVILLSGNLIDISGEVLTLLGITGVALLGANLPAAQPSVPSAAAPPADPVVPPAVVPPGSPARTPKWSDLIADVGGSGTVDVSRVQMFFFTVVSALFVLLKVFGNYAIPELPSGYLALMGISNGVYLAKKFVPKS
jgi:hypothetical protein